MNTESTLTLIVADNSEEQALVVKNNLEGFLNRASEWEKTLDSIQISDPNDHSNMSIAREVRLSFRNLRLYQINQHRLNLK